jgi:BMFP domain-containing protein YqiC
MPIPPENEIIELTEVVEEGHPDRPNLSSQSFSQSADKVLDELDLEKEIDQIFADLGTTADERASNDSKKSLDKDPSLDDLFDDSKPSASVHASLDADQLAPLLSRLALLEEKIARMDSAALAVSGQIETKLSSMTEEFANKLQEQTEVLRQALWSELEQNIGQMVRGAIAEANVQNIEEFSRQMAAQNEETTALLESKIQELQSQNASSGQNIAATVLSQMEEMRAGLLQELQGAIPAAAARIIREEIQALTQEATHKS